MEGKLLAEWSWLEILRLLFVSVCYHCLQLSMNFHCPQDFKYIMKENKNDTTVLYTAIDSAVKNDGYVKTFCQFISTS